MYNAHGGALWKQSLSTPILVENPRIRLISLTICYYSFWHVHDWKCKDVSLQFAYTVGVNLWATCQITAVDINHCCASAAKRTGEIISLLVLCVMSRKVEIAHPVREGDGRRKLAWWLFGVLANMSFISFQGVTGCQVCNMLLSCITIQPNSLMIHFLKLCFFTHNTSGVR